MTRWRKALAALRHAGAAMRRFERQSAGRPFEAQEAADDRFGELAGAAEAAMLRLLETPAPDLGALAMKIALVGEHLVWELDGGEACLDWLEADARSLALARARRIRYTGEA